MKLLGFNSEKHYLNAEEALNIFKFGSKGTDIQSALSKEIDDLETSIKTKSSTGCRVLTHIYEDYKADLVEKLVEHFKGAGFITDVYKNPGIKGFIILVIGW